MAKRENNISVLLSADEFNFIDNESYRQNISRSAVIRSLIFRERKRINDKVALAQRRSARAKK